MQLTTTPSIEGKRVTKYHGIVAGEAILGANLFKDLFAGIRDLVGGGVRRLMRRSCSAHAILRLRSYASAHRTWAQMQWLGSTSITK